MCKVKYIDMFGWADILCTCGCLPLVHQGHVLSHITGSGGEVTILVPGVMLMFCWSNGLDVPVTEASQFITRFCRFLANSKLAILPMSAVLKE